MGNVSVAPAHRLSTGPKRRREEPDPNPHPLERALHGAIETLHDETPTPLHVEEAKFCLALGPPDLVGDVKERNLSKLYDLRKWWAEKSNELFWFFLDRASPFHTGFEYYLQEWLKNAYTNGATTVEVKLLHLLDNPSRYMIVFSDDGPGFPLESRFQMHIDSKEVLEDKMSKFHTFIKALHRAKPDRPGAHMSVSRSGVWRFMKHMFSDLYAEKMWLVSDHGLEYTFLFPPRKKLRPVKISFGKFKAEDGDEIIDFGMMEDQRIVLFERGGETKISYYTIFTRLVYTAKLEGSPPKSMVCTSENLVVMRESKEGHGELVACTLRIKDPKLSIEQMAIRVQTPVNVMCAKGYDSFLALDATTGKGFSENPKEPEERKTHRLQRVPITNPRIIALEMHERALFTLEEEKIPDRDEVRYILGMFNPYPNKRGVHKNVWRQEINVEKPTCLAAFGGVVFVGSGTSATIHMFEFITGKSVTWANPIEIPGGDRIKTMHTLKEGHDEVNYGLYVVANNYDMHVIDLA